MAPGSGAFFYIMIDIQRATPADLQSLAELMNAYRMFYKQNSDTEAAMSFLKERLERSEAVAFIARMNKVPVGFTLLYPTFSSVSLRPTLILNDLYVIEEFRNKGVGSLLLNAAKKYGKAIGAKGVALETAIDNPAQKLYEKDGWKKSTEWIHYFWLCPDTTPDDAH